MNLIQTIGWFLLAIALLVFIHELGHYLVARWCGVKVLRFSIGFGPPLLRWEVGPDRTEWTLSAIPLGGYVKMLDERESPEGAIPGAELERAFSRKPLSQRALIVAAGPAANFLLAIALYAALAVSGVDEPVAQLAEPSADSVAARAGILGGERIVDVDGAPVRSWNEVRLALIDAGIARQSLRLGLQDAAGYRTATLNVELPATGQVDPGFISALGLELARGAIRITSVLPDSAAERAGLLPGDEILSVDDRSPAGALGLIDQIRAHPGVPMVFEVARAGATLRVEVTPASQDSDRPDEAGKRVGRIGAGIAERFQTVAVRHGPVEAVREAVGQTWDMSVFSLRMLGKMLTGELSWRNLSGPVAIADYAGQSAKVGWKAYLSFLALISVSLGVLNLLPIPVLDGGHLIYYGLEAALRRPLPERFMEITQKLGLGVVAAMMLLALFNDITRLIGS